jgi:hypothetical protein
MARNRADFRGGKADQACAGALLRSGPRQRHISWCSVDRPIGVARVQSLPPETLPEDLAGTLPTQDELESSMLPANGPDDE